ncbi:hypothetical protein [Amycolatopsis sulphurea]|uniref:hypothetical protein n=1 Tax=Amycolatopsis sulphurea TaxID=76022 RepID=UPI001FEC3B2B|nr:hypothetical protein [Amycolatopsis sulphurea]
MAAKFGGDGHRLELRYDFRFTGPTTPRNLPTVPDPSQVTTLSDNGAKQDFYRRLSQLQSN